jgi:hypothetical protein
MAQFKVYYLNGRDLDIGELWFQLIEAESAKAAYSKFLDIAGIHQIEIHVEKDLLSEIFTEHLDPEFLKERRLKLTEEQRNKEKENRAKKKSIELEYKQFHDQLSEAINVIQNTKSYFDLGAAYRVKFGNLFEQTIEEFEGRSLYPIETKFIKAWYHFNDRVLAESLLAKLEMAKPKAQQGKSPLGNMLMAGMAISTMKLSQDIGEVSDQVENISEGFGFEG